MAVSASFFIQAGASIWNPKVPIDFIDMDHTIIKRMSSDEVSENKNRVRLNF